LGSPPQASRMERNICPRPGKLPPGFLSCRLMADAETAAAADNCRDELTKEPTVDDFIYQNGRLHCESVAATAIAKAVGTPAYVYSAATFRLHYVRFAEAFASLRPTICFSIKSCPNIHICRLLAESGSGFDVVSGGELHRALRSGADPARIVYAGVGKTDIEIADALAARIGLFNVESEPELENLTRIAIASGSSARAALRINPDVDAHTHRHTTTGTKETKF